MGVEIKIWEEKAKEETSGNINIPREGKKKRSESVCRILRELSGRVPSRVLDAIGRVRTAIRSF